MNTNETNLTSEQSFAFHSKKYNFGVFIGRFQPFHIGHLHVVTEALKLVDKLIIIVGSNNKANDWKDPWTSADRITMIKDSLTTEQKNRVYFQTIEDRLYQNKEWETLVLETVNSILVDYSPFHLNSADPSRRPKICIVGYEKDDSSFYLNSFPQWNIANIKGFSDDAKDEVLSATFIRQMMYNNQFGYVKHALPEGSFNFIRSWMTTEAFAYVKDWYEFDKKYQQPYETLPYGTNFYCADNVIMQGSYVLMIRRKAHPGKGLWALPGGHINKNENAFDAALRELHEETGLKIPEKVLVGSFQGEKLFDHPDRSLRGRCGNRVGRTVSISHCFTLNPGNELPRVVPADDAMDARWLTIAEIRAMRNQIFEDHLDQINHWVARVDDRKRK